MPAIEALEELEEKVQQSYAVRFRRFCTEGPERLQAKHYHKWLPKQAKGKQKKDPRIREIAAFKDNSSQTRIPSFPAGRGVRVLTHLIQNKKEDKLKEAEVEETLRIYSEFNARKEQLLKRAPKSA